MSDRRKLVDYIKSWTDKKKIIILQGLRRTGKTTILLNLMKDNKSSINYFYEFNIFGNDDASKCKRFMQIAEENKDKQITLYLDEFQDFPDWNKFFKTIYDLYNNVCIIATGSVSHNTTGTNNTEGGRYFIIKVDPLSFSEFLDIHCKNDLNYEKHFNKYMNLGMYPDISWVSLGIDHYKKMVNDNVLEKIKSGLALERTKIRSATYIDSVLRHIIVNLGGFLTPSSISKKLLINEEMVWRIVEYLKATFVIKEINVLHKQKGKATMWNSKYYIADTSMYCFINHKTFEELSNSIIEEERVYSSFLLENVVLNHLEKINPLGYNNLFYHKTSSEDIDFVYVDGSGEKFIEVKSSWSVDCLSKQQLIFSKTKKLNVLYMGPSTEHNGIKYINIIDFLRNPIANKFQ